MTPRSRACASSRRTTSRRSGRRASRKTGSGPRSTAIGSSPGPPDGLLPLEVELAERLIAALAPRFALADAPAPGLAFWIDLAQAMAPARLSRAPQPGPGLRRLGAGGGAT